MVTTRVMRRERRTGGAQVARYRIQVVLATLLLGMFGVAAAQTTPHEGLQRTTIGTGLGQAELPPGGVFEPRVEAAVQYVANIELVGAGLPQINTAGLELAPGFYASYASGSAMGAIDYSLIGRIWDESDYDDVSHRLAANGQWIVLPEWFSLTGQAAYQDAVIDPRNGLNYGGLGIFGPGNLTEVATASAGPVLQHRFSDLELAANYTYGRVWYLDEGKGQPVVGFVTDQDSEDQSARVSFGTFDQQSRLSGQVFYDWERSDFEVALPYKYERVGLDAGIRFARTLALVGDVGRESDLDVSTSEGGLDSEFWSAGLRWDPSDRTSAEARYGERFFGDTYSFRATHRARFVEFDASYSEAPTIETRLLSLGGFEPGELPGGLPNGGLGGVSSSPFVGKDARVGVTAIGSITTLRATGFSYERDYIRGLLGDETRTGVELGATRQLASNLSADLAAGYTDFEAEVSSLAGPASDAENYYDTQVTFRLNRTSGLHLTLGGEAGYLIRNGDGNYEGWWVALRARWVP